MTKVIFVGMHNKPGKFPLDSSTRSGKLIDQIIALLPNEISWHKTNLYNVEYYPQCQEEKDDLSLDWLDRINPQNGWVIVTLGAEVHSNIPLDNIVKLAHPSSIWSKEKQLNYVLKGIHKIREKL